MTDEAHPSSSTRPGTRDPLVAVDRAVAEMRRGGFVVVRGPGASALLVQAAEGVTPHSLDRMADLTGSEQRLVLTPQRAAALNIPRKDDGPVLIAVEDGMSAQEVRDIADPATAVSFRLPPPVPAGSPDERGGYGAAVELAKLARLLPVALAAPLPEGAAVAEDFAAAHDFLMVEGTALHDYQRNQARSLRAASQARVPLAGAENARIVAYRPSDGGIEHLAIIIGKPKAGDTVLARLHSECFTGDLLGSLRCDCGDQLRGAIEEISAAGSGILIYLAQEGRGIGLVNKLRAYNLQDEGLDTMDANEQLGFDADERIYLPAAEILRDLGFTQVRLLTNNPEKVAALANCGIEVVERVAHVFPSNAHNEFYIETKKARGGHLF